MRIVCQQMILMKYHALFDIFEKKKKQQQNWNCRLLQIIGGALRVKQIIKKGGWQVQLDFHSIMNQWFYFGFWEATFSFIFVKIYYKKWGK